MSKITYSYSEAFKLQLVQAIESGRFNSCHEAALHYGIKGWSSVYKWVRKYGKNHLIGKVVRVETLDERSELKRLRERVRQLEELVADKELDLAIERGFLHLACQQAGIEDVAQFKKKEHGNARTTSLSKRAILPAGR